LSPVLFLIIAEGLRKLFENDKRSVILEGIKDSTKIFLTHLLFIDHVMIFGAGSVGEFQVLKSVLELLFSATDMQINIENSNILVYAIRDKMLFNLDVTLCFHCKIIEARIKYQGFQLKPCAYLVEIWL
jgi:hypothetical protein